MLGCKLWINLGFFGVMADQLTAGRARVFKKAQSATTVNTRCLWPWCKVMMILAGGMSRRPANMVALLSLRLATCQCFSGYLLTKASRFGIWTFASVSLFMTSFSPMILLSARM